MAVSVAHQLVSPEPSRGGLGGDGLLIYRDDLECAALRREEGKT
jgi:hypothetical protein